MKSFAQAYRWSIAGVVAAGVSLVQQIDARGSVTLIVGVVIFLAFIFFAAILEYFVRGWIDPSERT